MATTKRAAKGDAEAVQAMADFVTRVLQRLADHPDAETEGSAFWQLREALRADGFDIRREQETVDENEWPSKQRRLLGVRILPMDEPTAPLAETITALEADLTRAGLHIAVNCYRQAVDALVEQRFESANGQIRAFFEEVAIQCAVAGGFERTRQGEGGKAINYLVQKGHLPADAAGKYIQGLWGMTHTNGPHPGTTTAGEARFRLQAVTSAARYLIDQFFE